jgi:hypothetical protein
MASGAIRKWLVAASRPDRAKLLGVVGAALTLAGGAVADSASAAWTEKRGTGLVIPSYTYYRAARGRDADGHRVDRKAYVKNEFRVYSVYGLTDTVTLGLDGAARRVRDHAQGAKQEDLDWSEVATFARVRLYRWPRAVMSLQPLVFVPRKRDSGDSLGRDADKPEVELRALFGQSFLLLGHDGFAVAECGYRRRFGDSADQVRLDGTVGVRVMPRVSVLAQSFNIVSTRQPRDDGPLNYDLYKAQLSFVYDVTAGWAVQAGGFVEFAGRNTGLGRAGFLALWWRF